MAEFYVHASAEVSEDAIIGKGTKIWNQAQIREHARIGEGCIISKNVYIDRNVLIGSRVKIQNNVNVYEGVIVEDDVFIGPSVTFSNDMYPRAFSTDWVISRTIVKKGASIGAGAVIRCGICIGEFSMIGAGSVVVKDVPPNALVLGNPAANCGWVCKCGGPLDYSGCCKRCGQNYDIQALKACHFPNVQ